MPKVTVNDVGKSKTYPKFKSVNDNGIVKHFYRAGTNGIDYFQTVFPISNTSFEELNYSTLFADIICEVGIENKNYEEIQKLQSRTVGQISSNFVVQRENKIDSFNMGFKMGGYSLQSNLSAMKKLIKDTLNGFRLDELDRISDITKMHISGLERSLTNSGHYFAMTSSDSQISKWGAMSENSSGISF